MAQVRILFQEIKKHYMLALLWCLIEFGSLVACIKTESVLSKVIYGVALIAMLYAVYVLVFFSRKQNSMKHHE
jgi:hypothetical protein